MLILAPSQDLYLLRLVSAIVLNDGPVAIESASIIVSFIQGDLNRADTQGYPIPPADLAMMKQNLDALITHLEDDLPNGDPDRAAIVRRSAIEVLEQVEAYPVLEN